MTHPGTSPSGRRHPSTRPVLLTLLACLALAARAHDPLQDLPAPGSTGEALNVLQQSVANIPKCLETNQLKTVASHVANCSNALRLLQGQANKAGKPELAKQLEALFFSGDAIITATRQPDRPVEKARQALATHEAALKAVLAQYPPEDLATQVYICPMHPLERSTDPAVPCGKCSMKLIRRRIPASTTYEKPGEPSMKLVATPDRPLKVGQKATVTVSLTRNDGTPVVRKDLLTMHTEKIHLLIVDKSLGDYHHEHPAAGDKPGEYVFSFTPNRPGPYRVFADVVPAETSVQEYVLGEIPAEAGAQPMPVAGAGTTLTSEVDGFTYAIRLDAPGGRVPAGQPVTGWLTVTTPDGKPYQQLQPVMGAFAHLVAFNGDGKTVLHIHPDGPEPDRAEARGGPTLSFKLYAPVPGYYRLYAQVQVMDEAKFAPFDVTVGAAK